MSGVCFSVRPRRLYFRVGSCSHSQYYIVNMTICDASGESLSLRRANHDKRDGESFFCYREDLIFIHKILLFPKKFDIITKKGVLI